MFKITYKDIIVCYNLKILYYIKEKFEFELDFISRNTFLVFRIIVFTELNIVKWLSSQLWWIIFSFTFHKYH